MRRAITHTIRGYEVEIRPTMFGPAGHYDMYVYFLGRVPTAPSVHESTAQALAHAEQWLTWFDAQGGVAGYQQRMRAYYDTYAYTDESYRV
jgi:hypothetical protein